MNSLLCPRASIDKITLLIYPERTRVYLRHTTEELIEEFCARNFIPRNFFNKKHSGYGYAFMLPLSEKLDYRTAANNDGKPKMFVQICSSEKQRQRIRVEISGYPLKRADFYLAHKWLLKLTGNDVDCMAFDRIKVTRFDLALDFAKPIDELHFSVTRLGKVMLFLSTDGKIESATHGPDNRNLKVCIYNLLAKAASKGKNGHRRVKRNGDAKTRVELRINPNMMLSKVIEEFDFKKFFNRVEIFDPGFLDVTDIPQIMKNHFSAFGHAATLNALEPEQRKKMVNILKTFKYTIDHMDELVQSLKLEARNMKQLNPTIDYSKSKLKVRKTVEKYDDLFMQWIGQSGASSEHFICS